MEVRIKDTGLLEIITTQRFKVDTKKKLKQLYSMIAKVGCNHIPCAECIFSDTKNHCKAPTNITMATFVKHIKLAILAFYKGKE